MMNDGSGSTRFHLLERLAGNHWGAQALICLLVSIVSGVILALQYNPADPFYSTATIELVIPYGSFWRGLHYFSSQAFFLLLLVHVVVEIWEQKYSYSRAAWIRLTASVPVGLLLLFTGYVLRGDATGEAAGAIAEHIALAIPGIGGIVNSLLFDLSGSGVRKVYANHLIGLMAAGFICIWPHIRRHGTSWHRHLDLVFLMLAVTIVLPAPLEPDHIGLLHIAGPWFFLGLQELLRYIAPFWAGVVIPGSLLILLFFLPVSQRPKKISIILIGLWLAIYAVFTLISWCRVSQ